MTIPSYQELLETNTEAETLERKINMLAAEETGYFEAVDLLLDSKVRDIASKNQRIFILLIMANIAKMEISQNESNVLFKNRTADELILESVFVRYIFSISLLCCSSSASGMLS